jgi:primase-polymerase (primpol)-like protein
MDHSTLIYTGPTAIDLGRIPAVLKDRPQWVLWRGTDRVDRTTGGLKLNKIPIDPQSMHNADTTDPRTWGSFAHCVAALPVALETWQDDDPPGYRGGGLGFVFTDDDPYCGIDLDGCVHAATGQVAAWAQTHVAALASYTEVTPSTTGLHILVAGTLPPRGRKKGEVEIYSTVRFFTMTGWHLAGTPTTIAHRQDAVRTVHAAIFGPQPALQPPRTRVAVALAESVVLDKARTARHGDRFTALFAGDWTGYASQSEADLGLCVRLAFWTPQAAQIDQIFRRSGLMRDKWDEKRGALTYGQRTIQEALARQTDHYGPAQEAAGPFRPLATRIASRLASHVRSTL